MFDPRPAAAPASAAPSPAVSVRAAVAPAPLPVPCLVVGDAHIGAAPEAAERDLVALLRRAPAIARSVVLTGDVFDFWFAWGPAIPAAGHRTLAAIRDVVEAGVPVLWTGGNHDCWSGETLAALTGATYTLERWCAPIGGRLAWVHHGDGLRAEADRAYRRLRAVLRHPLSNVAFRWLPPRIGTWLAMRSSHTSRASGGMRARDGGAGLRAVAASWLAYADGPSLVLFGHTHVPALERLPGGIYGNAGAWYLERQYLLVDDHAVRRLRWNGGSAEDDVLDAIEGVAEEALAEGQEAVGGVGGDEPVTR